MASTSRARPSLGSAKAPAKTTAKVKAPAPDWLTHAHLDPLRSGAMRITGFTSTLPEGDVLVVEAIAMHRLSIVRELYSFGPGSIKTTEEGFLESRNLVAYEKIFERIADQKSNVQRVKCRVARGEKLVLDVLGRRVNVEMTLDKASLRGKKLKNGKRIDWLTPSRILLYQLCDAIPKDVLFSAVGELRKRAKIDPAAQPLFRFDEWQCPEHVEPLSSSPDLALMTSALAHNKAITKLPGTPSSTWQHSLDRVLALAEPKDEEQWTQIFDLRE
jgi:hypothetical protein